LTGFQRDAKVRLAMQIIAAKLSEVRTRAGLVILLGLSLGLSGCTSPDSSGGASPAPGWNQLRAGMSYGDVLRVLGPGDPELQEDIREAIRQAREAEDDYREAAEELRNQGVGTVPPMASSVQIDQGDYLLVFKDGKLASWRRK
jgi:hypothetical protein